MGAAHIDAKAIAGCTHDARWRALAGLLIPISTLIGGFTTFHECHAIEAKPSRYFHPCKRFKIKVRQDPLLTFAGDACRARCNRVEQT